MIEKTYKVLDKIDKYVNDNGFKELKNNIINSKSFDLIKKYNIEKDRLGSDKLLLIKKKLYDDDKINAYLKMQGDINLLELYINKNINDITKNKHSW